MPNFGVQEDPYNVMYQSLAEFFLFYKGRVLEAEGNWDTCPCVMHAFEFKASLKASINDALTRIDTSQDESIKNLKNLELTVDSNPLIELKDVNKLKECRRQIFDIFREQAFERKGMQLAMNRMKSKKQDSLLDKMRQAKPTPK